MTPAAPASVKAAQAYLQRIRLAAERTGMTEAETLLDEILAHVAALTTQLEAERDRADDWRGKYDHLGRSREAEVSALYQTITRETARADAAEKEAKELREAVEHGQQFVIEVAEANNGVGAYRELDPDDDTLVKVIGRMAEDARKLKALFRATLAQPAAKEMT